MAAAGPILIAGGGIGGLALALALAKSGRNAIVLEQHDQFATAGAGSRAPARLQTETGISTSGEPGSTRAGSSSAIR